METNRGDDGMSFEDIILTVGALVSLVMFVCYFPGCLAWL